MKRIVLFALLSIGTGFIANAQTDDIYATGRDQRSKQQAVENNSDERNSDRNNGGRNDIDNYDKAYQSPGNNFSGNGQNDGDSYQSYNNASDYVDMDDDYSYSSRIYRFEDPFYNMGYYSVFYNPFWYNPYWVDPFWGYNPWRPYVGISFGWGPYWSAGWGWNTWWGYGGFSCWDYPIYAGGWYGHCYNGYWNRYYAGIEGGHGYHNVRYAPRQMSLGNRIAMRSAGNSYRGYGGNQIGLRSVPMAAANHPGGGFRNNSIGTRGGNVMQRGGAENGRARGGFWQSLRGQSGAQQQRMSGNGPVNRESRGNFWGGGNRGAGGGFGRVFSNPGGNAPQRSFGGGNVFGGGRGNAGGGMSRSFGGGGGTRSFGGGGGMRSSGGGGGGRSSGGSGHARR